MNQIFEKMTFGLAPCLLFKLIVRRRGCCFDLFWSPTHSRSRILKHGSYIYIYIFFIFWLGTLLLPARVLRFLCTTSFACMRTFPPPFPFCLSGSLWSPLHSGFFARSFFPGCQLWLLPCYFFSPLLRSVLWLTSHMQVYVCTHSSVNTYREILGKYCGTREKCNYKLIDILTSEIEHVSNLY